MFIVKLSKDSFDESLNTKVNSIVCYECSSFSIHKYMYKDLDSYNSIICDGDISFCDEENKKDPDQLKKLFLLVVDLSIKHNESNKKFILFQNCKISIMNNGILMEESHFCDFMIK